jgi:hypothetical protein
MWENVYAGWRCSSPRDSGMKNVDSAHSAYAVLSAVNPEARNGNTEFVSCKDLCDWLLGHWGNPKNRSYHGDMFFANTDNQNAIRVALSGGYGVMVVLGRENYATLWEYDKMVCGRKYIEKGCEIYFWGLEVCYETVMEDLLRRVHPNDNMDEVAIAGFGIINDKSLRCNVEMGATIYQDKDNLFRIAGFCVGSSDYVKKEDGFKRLDALGVVKDKHRAFIHTHVSGSVTFSGTDFGAAYMSKKPVYMKHVSNDKILKAYPLNIGNATVDEVFFHRYFSKDPVNHNQLCFAIRSTREEVMGIDNCEDHTTSITREKCPVEQIPHLGGENQDIGRYCDYVSTVLSLTEEYHCAYGLFRKFGQKVEIVHPEKEVVFPKN